MIKKVALEKKISAAKIAEVIFRYQQNADKIFKMDDMYTDNVVRVSYFLKFHFLQEISGNYLSRLPYVGSHPEHERDFMVLDTRNGQVAIVENTGNCDFLNDIHIGEHIRKIAQRSGWTQQYMAKLLQCTQSNISYLYHSQKSITVKELIRISNAIQHNLIAEVYLPKIKIASSFPVFDGCIISMNEQQIYVQKANNPDFPMIFRRQDDEK